MQDNVDLSRTWTPPIPKDPAAVRLVLISECAAESDADNYEASANSLFDTTTLEAFAAAGLLCDSVGELREMGIHLTVAIRHPKKNYGIKASAIREASIVLEEELNQFPNAIAYLLMGDVAIAAINAIARRRIGRRAIPADSTYRIRGGEYFLGDVRLFPSYLQAGPAWRIEASKREMVAEDIHTALELVGMPETV